MKSLTGLVAGLVLLSACDDAGLQCKSDETFQHGDCIKNYGVRLNSVGYTPDRVKRASFAAPAGDFQVIAADGSIAKTGTATGPKTDIDTGELLWEADFSSVTTPGAFHVDAAGGTVHSATFQIDASVYDTVLGTLMLGMYGQRCGGPVSIHYGNDTFEHEQCHTQDAHMDFYPDGPSVIRDGTRGWHDAGDYGKYTNNGSFAVAMMLAAWERHQSALAGLSLPIPEHGGSLPDFLAECKWQLDWLMDMEFDDGSVSDRITTPGFDQLDVSPEASTNPRRFAPVTTVAVADFTATMALAARVYQAYDPMLAQAYAAAASKSYAFLVANPEIRPNLASTFTGGYQSPDGDDRLWAAAEVWELTGDAAALADFEQRAQNGGGKPAVNANFDWANLDTLGQSTYVLSQRDGRDPTLLDALKQAFTASADNLAASALDPLPDTPVAGMTNGYGRDLVAQRVVNGKLQWVGFYNWGVNGAIARTAMVLDVANMLSPNVRYLDTTSLQLDHLLGRNFYGRSFVTGLGFDPPHSPHHRPSIADAVIAPWPGLLVGGTHNETNPSQAAMSWNDDSGDPTTNEVAINWNAPMIYAAAMIAP